MATPDELARELARAFRARRPPEFSLASTSEWVRAIDAQLAKGEHELAHHAVRSLRTREPDLEWARTVYELLERMRASTGASQFWDDPDKDVQIVTRSGTDTVVFAFCDAGHRMAIPLTMFQRWLEPLSASAVYLRDFHSCLYLKGIRSLGPDRAASVAALRAIATDLGARRILCLGNSSGGFGALRYGLELGAERVLCLGTAVNMEPAFNVSLRQGRLARWLRKYFPEEPLDLRAFYVAARSTPSVILAYGEQAWDDRLHAEHMADVPGVRLLPVAGHDTHGVVAPLVRDEQLGILLARFLDTEDVAR